MNKPQAHGLRTTGTHTGNFGRARVQAKREHFDFSDNVLKKENLRIPTRQEAYSRLQEAYQKTDDPRLKKFLFEELAKIRAQTQLYAARVIPGGTPVDSVDPDLDPKGRFRDFGTAYDVGERDSTYEYLHRVR